MTLSNHNRKEWSGRDFWQAICPHLSIGDDAEDEESSNKQGETVMILQQEAERRRQGLIQEGYARVDQPLNPILIGKLLRGVEALQSAGYPASFIFLFDEAWELAKQSQHIMQQSTHPSNRFNYDILAWYIESGGFSPHRDRQPQDAKASFHSASATTTAEEEEEKETEGAQQNLQAKFVTHWIALSDATPENSCLYVIPRSYDPGYLEGDIETEDPLRRALPDKQAFQHIRCLPRPSGTSLLFTHRIIHWGSAREASSTMPPRVAISFVCSDPGYEKTYLTWFSLPKDNDKESEPSNARPISPPFAIRLLLVCAQLLIYYQRFDLPKETLHACYQMCKDHSNELEESYRQKVFLEYVNAMKEEHQHTGGKKEKTAKGEEKNESGVTTTQDDKDEEQQEEAEEAMLEEMLNAESGGYGEYEDDYDEANKDDNTGGMLFGGVVAEGADDEDGDEDEEYQGVSLFGKRQSTGGGNGSNEDDDHNDVAPSSKRSKM